MATFKGKIEIYEVVDNNKILFKETIFMIQCFSVELLGICLRTVVLQDIDNKITFNTFCKECCTSKKFSLLFKSAIYDSDPVCEIVISSKKALVKMFARHSHAILSTSNRIPTRGQ